MADVWPHVTLHARPYTDFGNVNKRVQFMLGPIANQPWARAMPTSCGGSIGVSLGSHRRRIGDTKCGIHMRRVVDNLRPRMAVNPQRLQTMTHEVRGRFAILE